jgi:hypothetical protein
MSQQSVCSDEAIVCMAYPHGEYDGYNFLAAGFSVSIVKDDNTKRKCLANSRVGLYDAWTGGWIDDYAYRKFHRNKCYELSIRISCSQFGNYDSGSIKLFTAKDWKTVFGRLHRTIHTFRFLK